MSLIRSDRRSMVGSLVAIVGVALSVTTMLLTVSVSGGFGREITARLLAFEAPLSVTAPPAVDNGMVSVTPELREVIAGVCGDVETVPVWQTPAMLKSSDAFDGLILKNLAGSSHRDFISKALLRGEIPNEKGELLLSSATAGTLGVDTTDRVDIALFVGDGAVKMRRATVTGVFDTHFVDYDDNVAFIDSATLIGALSASDLTEASRIEIYSSENIADLPQLAHSLQQAIGKANFNGTLPAYYRVDNFTDTAAPYLSWLALLDVNVLVILGLMAFIAAFTLTSSMIVLVLERVKEIGILMALGATRRQLRAVFMILGLKLLLRGIVFADILSVVLIALQQHFHMLPLDPRNYYLDYVPMELSPMMFVIVNIGALLLGALTMLVPVRVIATVRPVKAIAFE